MKRIGVREFRDHATRYLGGDEVLAVERHGQPIGFYIPTAPHRDEALADALSQLEAVVKSVLQESGMTEEDLVQAITGMGPGSSDDFEASERPQRVA